MEIEPEIKENMQQQVQQFMKDLFEVADYDPSDNRGGEGMKPAF